MDKCDFGTINNISELFNLGTCIISKSVIPLLLAIAVLAFIWGIIILVMNPDSEDKKNQGKKFMLWGIIALFVIISVWGLVAVLTNTLGIKPLIPQLSNK